MIPRFTAFPALPLAALVLSLATTGASADPSSRPERLAQIGPAPQEQAAPEEGGEDRGERRHKRDGDGEAPPPAPAADTPPEAQMEAPPEDRKEGRKRRSTDDAPPPQHSEAPPPAPAADVPPEAQMEAPPEDRKEVGKRRSTDDAPPPQHSEAPPPAPAADVPPEAQMEAPPEDRKEGRKRRSVDDAPPAQQDAAPPQDAPPPATFGERKKRRDGGDSAPAPSSEPAQSAAPVETPPEQPEPLAEPTPPPAVGLPQTAPPAGDQPRAFSGGGIDAVKKQRRQRIEEGGKRTVIEEPGDRVIIKEGGQTTIRHDETERLRRTSRDVRRERRPDGTTLTIAVRPGGIEIYTVFDADGRLLRRYRRGRDGRELSLIDNRRAFRHHRHDGPGFVLDLRPPRVRIPRERYIIEYDRASEEDVYEALMAPPVEELERGYSLDEIRYNRYLRDRMRRIDLDTVNFAFGSWEVAPSQYAKLARVARAINRILDRRPDEMFLVEGHTDAVGSDIDNLTLSDRRAEEVAYILTEHFDVPPENLITQGYGEQFLKIDTLAPERINRRVAVRRITPLLARDDRYGR